MTQTKALINLHLPDALSQIIMRYISPNKKRKRNPNGYIYYLSCCYVGLSEEFQRLRLTFPTRDDDALCHASCGGNLELVKYMISLGIRDERQNALETAVESEQQEIVEYLANHTQQWFLSLHSTGMTLKREHADFIDHLLYIGACSNNKFLVKFALKSGAGELDDAEYVAVSRGHAVAKIISDHIDQL